MASMIEDFPAPFGPVIQTEAPPNVKDLLANTLKSWTSTPSSVARVVAFHGASPELSREDVASAAWARFRAMEDAEDRAAEAEVRGVPAGDVPAGSADADLAGVDGLG